ncbi:hypothetical protein BDA99DRAFT_541348 [Phascolomyces articulosus]|uniref:Uncharacterized protein n=1 Tax=Phascolomyces articulosus TaxID=60185 RepID=A0AAD5K1X0_9FUNG|nr:hypothetical protein BDA99DRAFT_541348 [Phascolomyces articulosus]
MANEYKVKLKSYLQGCKTSIRFAKLSQFIKSNKDTVLQYKSETINPNELKSLLKKEFNTYAANMLPNTSFAADVDNIDWTQLAKDKQAHQTRNKNNNETETDKTISNNNNDDNLEVECYSSISNSSNTINEGGSTVALDTSLLQPLKQYLMKKVWEIYFSLILFSIKAKLF